MGQYSSSIRMGRLTQLAILLAIFSLAAGDLLRHSARRGRGGRRLRNRAGRQDDGDVPEVQGGVDFSGCVEDPDSGLCCVEKEETVKTLQKDPILECTHKNFEKTCQITFKQQAINETVQKCYKPLERVCNGQGPEECRTVYESSCTTRYVEKQPGKFVGDTACEKLPVEICGA